MDTLKRFVSLAVMGLYTSLLLVGCGKSAINNVAIWGHVIAIPTPTGFSPVGDKAPAFSSLESSLVPRGTKLVEYYLTDNDLKEVIEGRSKSRERSLSILTNSSEQAIDFNVSNYVATVIQIRVIDKERSVDKTDTPQVASQGTTEALSPHSFDQRWLGIFMDQKDAIGTATIAKVASGNSVQERVGALVVLRVKDRELTLRCTNDVATNADIAWAKDTCRDWAKAILGANL